MESGAYSGGLLSPWYENGVAYVQTMILRALSFEEPFDLDRPIPEMPAKGKGYGDELARAVALGLRDSLLPALA